MDEQDTVQIPLTRGAVATIDAADLSIVSRFRWWATKRRGTHKTQYAKTRVCGKLISMHRLIMGAKPGQIVDHRDRSGVNNTRANLRFATASQNRQNAQRCGGTSRFKGVSLHRRSGKWRAVICLNRKLHHLGLFDDEIEAAKAYDRAARELHGEFARPNFA